MRLGSSTAEIQPPGAFTLDGRSVILINIPGLGDTSGGDKEVLEAIADFLANMSVHIDLCCFPIFRIELGRYREGSKFSGVIYLHRISDVRFTGISGRNFKMFRELCGDATLKSVVLVTNMWGDVSRDAGKVREDELSSHFFKQAIAKGARMTRHYNTEQSAHDIVRMVVGNQPVALQIQRELVDERKDVIDTAAGQAVNRELDEQIGRHQAKLKEVQEEMQALEEERRKLREIKKDSEGRPAARSGAAGTDDDGIRDADMDEEVVYPRSVRVPCLPKGL